MGSRPHQARTYNCNPMSGFFRRATIPRVVIQLIVGIFVFFVGITAIVLARLHGTTAGVLELVVIAAAVMAGDGGGNNIWKWIELRRLRRR